MKTGTNMVPKISSKAQERWKSKYFLPCGPQKEAHYRHLDFQFLKSEFVWQYINKFLLFVTQMSFCYRKPIEWI